MGKIGEGKIKLRCFGKTNNDKELFEVSHSKRTKGSSSPQKEDLRACRDPVPSSAHHGCLQLACRFQKATSGGGLSPHGTVHILWKLMCLILASQLRAKVVFFFFFFVPKFSGSG